MKAWGCHAIGCRAAILPSELFCERHQRMCQSDVARVLAKKFRPGKPLSKVCAKVLALAVKEILYFQTEGHHIPRDAAFQFDDDGQEIVNAG